MHDDPRVGILEKETKKKINQAERNVCAIASAHAAVQQISLFDFSLRRDFSLTAIPLDDELEHKQTCCESSARDLRMTQSSERAISFKL